MKQVKITKPYKLLKAGDTPNVEDTYADILVKKGVAVIVEPKEKK